MKNIHAKRIERELELLHENSDIPIQLLQYTNEEYYIDIKIPHSLIPPPGYPGDVNFIFYLPIHFPFNSPKLYCTTPFSSPQICDGRDILIDIIGQAWSTEIKLVDVVKKLPLFISEFLRHLNSGFLVMVGMYYLGEKYDRIVLDKCLQVTEIFTLNGKNCESQKLLMVSDSFICLFDQEKKKKNNLQLSFWANIQSLSTIKKNMSSDICRFFWKQKNNKLWEMTLQVEKSSNLIDLLLKNMQKFGISYTESKVKIGSMEGRIPPIDIETVEEKIVEIEAEIEKNPTMELVQFLMTLYENAVNYYSATSNLKYEYYTEKIHQTLASPKMNEFLSQPPEVEEQHIEKPELNIEDGEKGLPEIQIKEEQSKKEMIEASSQMPVASEIKNDQVKVKGKLSGSKLKKPEVGIKVYVPQEDTQFDYGSGSDSD